LRGTKESLFTLTHNGKELNTAKTRAVGRSAVVDAGDRMDRARQVSADWSGLIKRGGLTPKVEHSVTLANDSLSDQQNRLLHVRAICTLRNDGVKQIEQHLYNPHGSMFYVLSDEAPGSGGRGLAPDAASYAAAGRADPGETHVYLDTHENDDFARTVLAMSEQTCFLHALCRSDLKVKVSIQPYSEAGLLPAAFSSPDAE
jgi:hypothetical protein